MYEPLIGLGVAIVSGSIATVLAFGRAVFDFRQGRAIVVHHAHRARNRLCRLEGLLGDANNTSMPDEAALGIAGTVGIPP